MPIKRIFWDGNSGRDIHVLRGGVTRDLTRALRFVQDDGSPNGVVHFADNYLVQFADVTLTFTPLFRGAVQGNEFVGHQNGLRVIRGVGAVIVDAVPGPNVKNNFIIEVEARNDGDGRIFRETIRVHVHGAVTQAWLTPNQLTVRPPNGFGNLVRTAYRFAVRAQFNDGTVGDLTDGHNVTWTAPGGHVHPTTGRIQLVPGDTAGASIPVTATLPVGLGGASTLPGPTIRIADSLNRLATPPPLTLVAGGAAPSTAAVEDALNVLLLADGFRREDETAFDTIVDGFVHHLKTNQLTKPFNLLTGAMNFWKLFVPSDQIGISLLSEVFTFGIQPYAAPVPAVRKPPPDPPAPQPRVQWDMSNLLYVVGLPVPGDEAPARTPAILKSEWQRLLQTDPGPNIIDDDVVFRWKLLAKRTLIDEVDGFPGLAVGAIPAASDPNTNFLKLHPNRVEIRLLRQICGTLGSPGVALPDGRPLGLLWKEEGTAVSSTTNTAGYAIGARTITLAATGSGGFVDGDAITFAGDPNRYVLEIANLVTEDVSTGVTIQLAAPGLRRAIPASAVPITIAPLRFHNGDFVVIISPVRGGRAGNTASLGRYVAISSATSDVFPVRAVAGRNTFTVDISAPPATVEADMARTLAHEIAHSMGLGDEYVDFDQPFSDAVSPPFANLQRELDTQIPDPADPSRRIIHGNEIQWNWHRITAAAIVNGDITFGPGLDEFRIPVVPDVSFRFSVGDTLRLRARTWGRPLRKLGPLELSGDLVILERPSADAIVVRAVHVISAQAFPPGSLLYTPKPAPASVLSPLYPYAEMVAKNVKEAITRNRRPLLDVPGPNNRPQVPLVDAEGGRTPVADLRIDQENRPRIVGLYTGGDRFASGIFHPTGQCMMRNDKDSHAEFCAVCRYVMVDLVAPEFHPEIDKDYDKVYPQR